MANYKTDFELEGSDGNCSGVVKIIGAGPLFTPYVSIEFYTHLYNKQKLQRTAWIKDKDLERFAVNILRSLNSKRLKT